MKLFKYENQGNEAYLNLDQVVTFTIEQASEYGTSFFLIITTAGPLSLNTKDRDRFLALVHNGFETK